MKKASRMLFSFVLMVVLSISSAASADLFYSASGGMYEPGGLGVYIGNSEKGNTLIQNLENVLDIVTGEDGKMRIININNDTLKIYNPGNGEGWEKQPEIEAKLDSSGTSDPRGTEMYDGNFYVAYMGMDIGFSCQITGNSKIVQYDAKKNFEKVNEFIYKPELKDPKVGAEAMDVFAYRGKIYGLYVGYSKDNAQSGSWYNVYGVAEGYLVEFDKNLQPTGREMKLPTIANFTPSMVTAFYRSYILRGSKLLMPSPGNNLSLDYSQNAGICIVDLDKWTASKPIDGEKLGSDWNVPFQFVTATPEGDVFFTAADYWGGEEYVYKSSFESFDKILETPGELSMAEMEEQGLVEKIWSNDNWSGMFSGVVEIDYDETTGYLWWNPGDGGVYRYDYKGTKEIKFFESVGMVAGIMVPHLLPRDRGKSELVDAELPSDVDIDVETPYTLDFSNIEETSFYTGLSQESLEKNKEDKVTVKPQVAATIATKVFKDVFKGKTVTENEIVPLPIFTATMSANKIGMFSIVVTGNDLMAENIENVKLLKITGDSTGVSFTHKSEITGTDGSFVIQNMDSSLASGKIDKTVNYKLSVFIKEGGEFDTNTGPGEITDPLALVKEPVNSVTPNDTTESTVSSSGGCNAGFAGMLLLGLIPAFIFKKKD